MGILVEFLESRRSWENQKPPENRQKTGLFWASPFTLVARAIRNAIRANRFARIIRNWDPNFYSASGRFTWITQISDSRESPDSCESCESIRANHATKPFTMHLVCTLLIWGKQPFNKGCLGHRSHNRFGNREWGVSGRVKRCCMPLTGLQVLRSDKVLLTLWNQGSGALGKVK